MVNMYHSVITPTSYQGYQSLAEDKVLAVKIGCAERAERGQRQGLVNAQKQLTEKPVERQSSLNILSNTTIEKNNLSLYNQIYQPPTVDKVNEVPSTKNVLLHHHNNYRRNVQKKNPTTGDTNMQSTYHTFHLQRNPDSTRPDYSTVYNKRKWKVDSDFKPASLNTQSTRDRMNTSHHQRDVLKSGTIGVSDPSHHRVELRSNLSDQTTYRQDIGNRNENPRDRLPDKIVREELALYSTTRDLAEGTTKNVGYSLSYSGFVPRNNTNREKMYDSRPDVSKEHTRDILRLTKDHNIPGYSGFKPNSVHNDYGPVRPSSETTHNRDFGHEYYTYRDTEKEGFKRKWILSNFFTGPTDQRALVATDGNADADLFYKMYRPKEALPKLGFKSDRSWISDHDLKRSYVFSST